MPEPQAHTTRVETTLQAEIVSTRVLTVPNVLTFVRIAAIPFLMWLILAERDLAAVVSFALIAGTDFVDGKIARRLDQVSALGKMLDPAADRALLLGVAIAVTVRGIVPWPLVLVLAGREIAVSVIAIYFKAKGVQLEVRYAGKWAATFVMFCFAFFLGATWCDSLGDVLPLGLRAAGWVCGALGAVLGWYTVFVYAQDAKVSLSRLEHEAASPCRRSSWPEAKEAGCVR